MNFSQLRKGPVTTSLVLRTCLYCRHPFTSGLIILVTNLSSCSLCECECCHTPLIDPLNDQGSLPPTPDQKLDNGTTAFI